MKVDTALVYTLEPKEFFEEKEIVALLEEYDFVVYLVITNQDCLAIPASRKTPAKVILNKYIKWTMRH